MHLIWMSYLYQQAACSTAEQQGLSAPAERQELSAAVIANEQGQIGTQQ